MSDNEKYTCDEANAAKIYDWLQNRGGIFIWKSVNLSNPGGSWTSPAHDADGKETSKPNWQCESLPSRYITGVDDVMVTTAKEVKRFHVATRMGGNGLSIKVTDGGSRRLRAEVARAEEKYGKAAWHEFDYWDDKNAVIMVEDSAIPMAEWAKSNAEKLKLKIAIVDGDLKIQEATA
jgi:hypothetical protein